MTEEKLQCNKCRTWTPKTGGKWRGKRWFCQTCNDYMRISDGDVYGSKRSKVQKESALDLINKMKPRSIEEELIKGASSLPTLHDTCLKYISRNGVFKTKVKFRPNENRFYGSEIKKHYEELLQDKLLKNDKQLLNKIIDLRNRSIRNRMVCHVTLYSKGNIVGQLKIFQLLIEDGQHIVDYWVGRGIDPSSIGKLGYDFHNYLLQRTSSGNVNTSIFPNKYYVVDDVDTEFEFA